MSRYRIVILFSTVLMVPAPVPARGGEKDLLREPKITEDNRSHWSFQPLVRPKIPAVKSKHPVRNPIDAFILAPLETAGLEPMPEAGRATLIRRLSFDLTGLPPTPEQV